MERRKSTTLSTGDVDEDLATVKAAAWAWYLRGSGNEGKSVREFDLSPSPRSPLPSRYKLEALRAAAPEPNPTSTSASDLSTRSNSLLDLYEIERITRELDLLIASSNRSSPVNDEPKRAHKRVSGFWIQNAVGICGARRDAVVEAVVARRRRRRRGT